MEQTGVVEITPPKGRRPTAFGRAARAKRIFARLREGWAYDECRPGGEAEPPAGPEDRL